MLYAVDVKNHHYRLEDDLGRSVSFEFPDDARHLSEIKSLVAARVEVIGHALVAPDGGFHEFEVELIEPVATPVDAIYSSFDLEKAIAEATPVESLETLRISDLTLQEGQAFWEAIQN